MCLKCLLVFPASSFLSIVLPTKHEKKSKMGRHRKEVKPMHVYHVPILIYNKTTDTTTHATKPGDHIYFNYYCSRTTGT